MGADDIGARAYSFGASLAAAAATGTFMPVLEPPDEPWDVLARPSVTLPAFGEACELPPFFSLAFNACFKIWLALKVSTRRSLILIGSPVWGLRPGRWRLSR